MGIANFSRIVVVPPSSVNLYIFNTTCTLLISTVVINVFVSTLSGNEVRLPGAVQHAVESGLHGIIQYSSRIYLSSFLHSRAGVINPDNSNGTAVSGRGHAHSTWSILFLYIQKAPVPIIEIISYSHRTPYLNCS